MGTTHAPLVVYSHEVKHHLGIVEHRDTKEAYIICADCAAEYTIPLSLLGSFLDKMGGHQEAQIVSWTAYNER